MNVWQAVDSRRHEITIQHEKFRLYGFYDDALLRSNPEYPDKLNPAGVKFELM